MNDWAAPQRVFGPVGAAAIEAYARVASLRSFEDRKTPPAQGNRQVPGGKMTHEWYTLDELAKRLGRNRRGVEKLVNRGRLPGHKVGGEWRFNSVEITHWLEQQLRSFSDEQLAGVEESHRSTEVDADVPVTSLLRPETVQVPLPARTRRSVIKTLVEVAGRTWKVWEPAVVLEAVLDRESVLPTGFENGMAIPHPRNPLPDALGASVVAYGRTSAGIAFGAPRRALTDIFFLVLCRDARTHLQVLARLGRMMQFPDFTDRLRGAEDAGSTWALIREADEQIGE